MPEKKINVVLAIRIWLTSMVIICSAIAYLCLGAVYNWWPYKSFNEAIPELASKEGLLYKGWQIYHDEQNNFEFKYPPNYILNEEGTSSPLLDPKFLTKSLRLDMPENNYSGTNFIDANIIFNVYTSGDFIFVDSQCRKKIKDSFYDSEIYRGNEGFFCYEIVETVHTGEIDKKLVFGELDKILATFKPLQFIDTSNWKIYKNVDSGFIIKYPFFWKMTAEGNWASFYIDSSDKSYRFEVSVLSNPRKLSAKNYAEETTSDNYEKSFPVYIDETEGYELYNVKFQEEIFLASGNYIYKITFPLEGNTATLNPGENNKIAHQILSNFKFVK